jgi:hypothetical protein
MADRIKHPFYSVLVEPKASVEEALDDYCLARDSRLEAEPEIGDHVPHSTLSLLGVIG